MNIRIKHLFGAGLLTAVLFVAPVAAHEGEADRPVSSPSSGVAARQTSNDSQVVAQATTSESELPSEEEKTTTLEDRIAKRKAEQKLKLTTAEQTKLKGKCVAAQAVLKGVNEKVSNNAANHSKKFTDLSKKLTSLSAKLKAQGLDTTKLDSEITELNAKITAYKTNLASYKLTISDLTKVGCAQDPAAFKASLQTARTLKEKVKTEVSDIRTYVNGTIKPTIVELRQQLETQPATTQNGGQ